MYLYCTFTVLYCTRNFHSFVDLFVRPSVCLSIPFPLSWGLWGLKRASYGLGWPSGGLRGTRMAFFLGRAGKAQQGLEGLRGPPKSYKARKLLPMRPYQLPLRSSQHHLKPQWQFNTSIIHGFSKRFFLKIVISDLSMVSATMLLLTKTANCNPYHYQ